MLSTIKPWGNSQGLYIPKEYLKQLGLNVHDRVEMTVEEGRLIISKDNSNSDKAEALEVLKKLRKPMASHFDWKEELCEYLDERYGDA